MSTHIPTLQDADLKAALDYDGVEAVLQEVFEDLAHGRAQALARTRIDCGPVKLSAMGGIWLARNVAGIKSYPTVNGGFGFLVNLFDLASNVPLAVIPGTELTRFRTAALARLAARSACVGAPTVVCLFGFGAIGRSIAAALDEALPIREIRVVDPGLRPGQLEEAQPAFRAQLMPSDAAGVRGASLVVTATRSKTPVFDGTLVSPGTTVVAMGTSLPTGSELDDALLSRAAQVVVEWKPQSLVEAGEVVLGLRSGALRQERIVDLPQVYRREAAWRNAADDIVVFKSVGIGLADVAAAWLAQSRLAERRAVANA